MNIDWDLVIKIGVPLGTLVLGKYLDRWLEKRPKLISYLVNASAFNVRGQQPVTVHTHAIVVQNAGRVAATNVRIAHHVLPESFQIHPPVHHEVVRTDGIAEIVIPTLVPGEQLTISYLYFPPLLWSQIHAQTKSDQGLAKIITVLPTPQPPKWLIRLIWVFVFVGVVSLLYVVIGLIRHLFP